MGNVSEGTKPGRAGLDEGLAASGVEIHQDLTHQRRLWTIERVGWAVMAALVLAGFLGLFGSGPLSHVTVGGESDPIRLVLNRYARLEVPTRLQVYLSPEATRTERAKIWLGMSYLDCVRVRSIVPEPDHVEAGTHRYLYTFRITEPGHPTLVTFHVNPDQVGILHGDIGIDGQEPLRFWQMAYP